MTQPSKSTSKLVDGSDNGQIGEQGSAVTAAAAATYAAPSVTSVAVTDALDGATFTGTALTTSSTPTVDELEAIAGSLGLIVNANKTDIADTNTELAALAVDVALIRTAVNALIDRVEAHGLIADN